ncbi:uncharacterized protein J3D65DRAFT_149962 [Phyllosticta citribraziliensis]|uniref:Uncharacterized protein n=1 Tax=Phyllosticta citribraziliensis TaxID=989973 RepID=A0ABR1L4Q9_9PEZI
MPCNAMQSDPLRSNEQGGGVALVPFLLLDTADVVRKAGAGDGDGVGVGDGEHPCLDGTPMSRGRGSYMGWDGDELSSGMVWVGQIRLASRGPRFLFRQMVQPHMSPSLCFSPALAWQENRVCRYSRASSSSLRPIARRWRPHLASPLSDCRSRPCMSVTYHLLDCYQTASNGIHPRRRFVSSQTIFVPRPAPTLCASALVLECRRPCGVGKADNVMPCRFTSEWEPEASVSRALAVVRVSKGMVCRVCRG